jgi:hypothetical protein
MDLQKHAVLLRHTVDDISAELKKIRVRFTEGSSPSADKIKVDSFYLSGTRQITHSPTRIHGVSGGVSPLHSGLSIIIILPVMSPATLARRAGVLILYCPLTFCYVHT